VIFRVLNRPLSSVVVMEFNLESVVTQEELGVSLKVLFIGSQK
jgi:hypothetical protein